MAHLTSMKSRRDSGNCSYHRLPDVKAETQDEIRALTGIAEDIAGQGGGRTRADVLCGHHHSQC